MKVRRYLIRAFTCVVGLVDKNVELVMQRFIINTKNSTLPCSFKVHGAWLEGVTREMGLLGKIKRNMILSLERTIVVTSWLSVFWNLLFHLST